MQLRTDRLVAGGDAMARDPDGRVVFVTGALPGELVEVEVQTAKKDFARGRLIDVLERSPRRDSPSCAHRRAGCGGCDWMHLEPSAQFDAKVDIVTESLRRVGRLDAETVERLVHRGGAVSPFGYRTTIRVVGGPGSTPGYREQASDRVVPVTSCPVAESRLSRLLAQIELDEGAELTLRTSVATGAITAIWDRRFRGAIRGLPPEVHVGERAWLTERVAGHDLRVSAPSFFQSGHQAAELLVAAVGDAAPELAGAAHAVDAYGGVGLFAVTAMAGAQHVTVVESSVSACRDAEHNLSGRSASVVRADVAGWTPPPGTGPTAAVDVVVADPARPGLGRPGVTALAATRAGVVVLVSCDPVSLARDVTLMADAGYRPVRVEVLDLFPNTHHVETVTRFVDSVR
jgi:23S rRNA (uracil1939-C5)-methyltransferase